MIESLAQPGTPGMQVRPPLPPAAPGVDAQQILTALHVRQFVPHQPVALDATALDYQGYAAGTASNEIHTDPSAQYVFVTPVDLQELEEDGVFVPSADVVNAMHQSAATHQQLRAAVRDGTQWYVLLHGPPRRPPDRWPATDYVVLFAVGESRRGRRLIGVVTHQVCHNLCD